MMNVGIEIEFTGVKRENVAAELAKLWGTESVAYDIHMFDGSVRRGYRVKDLCSQYWNIVMDKSIRPDCAFGHITLDYDEYMCELVSPVLKNIEDMDMLKQALSCILKMGGFVNETCGVHIHIDCPTGSEVVYELFMTVGKLQEKLILDFGVPYNRLGRYCQLYSKEFIEGMRKEHDYLVQTRGYMSIKDIQNYLYKELGEGCDRNDPKNPARYYVFNLDSIHKLNTLEFRWFNSTLSYEVILMYLKSIKNLVRYGNI